MLCSVNIKLLISHALTGWCIFVSSMSAYFSTMVMPIRQMSSKQMVSEACSSVVRWGSSEPTEIQSRNKNDNVSEISLFIQGWMGSVNYRVSSYRQAGAFEQQEKNDF